MAHACLHRRLVREALLHLRPTLIVTSQAARWVVYRGEGDLLSLWCLRKCCLFYFLEKVKMLPRLPATGPSLSYILIIRSWSQYSEHAKCPPQSHTKQCI